MNSDSAVTALVEMPALPNVTTDPATAALPAVAMEPATAALAAVAIEPATAALAAVAMEPATAALPLVATDRETDPDPVARRLSRLTSRSRAAGAGISARPHPGTGVQR